LFNKYFSSFISLENTQNIKKNFYSFVKNKFSLKNYFLNVKLKESRIKWQHRNWFNKKCNYVYILIAESKPSGLVNVNNNCNCSNISTYFLSFPNTSRCNNYSSDLAIHLNLFVLQETQLNVYIHTVHNCNNKTKKFSNQI